MQSISIQPYSDEAIVYIKLMFSSNFFIWSKNQVNTKLKGKICTDLMMSGSTLSNNKYLVHLISFKNFYVNTCTYVWCTFLLNQIFWFLELSKFSRFEYYLPSYKYKFSRMLSFFLKDILRFLEIWV